MEYIYKVDVFVPKVAGCGASDVGWDKERCLQFQGFLNANGSAGWRLSSTEYRQVTTPGGCGNNSGAWLVCIFERQK